MQRLQMWTRILLSVLVLAAALFIILSGGYEPDAEKWAYVTVGLILGYWLKT